MPSIAEQPQGNFVERQVEYRESSRHCWTRSRQGRRTLYIPRRYGMENPSVSQDKSPDTTRVRMVNMAGTKSSARYNRLYSQQLLFWPSGDQHRCLLAVLPVLVTEVIDQIAFFKLERDENVPGRCNSKQQMSSRHHRSRPKGNNEPQHDRMAYELIEPGRSETQLLCIRGYADSGIPAAARTNRSD
jgi:hypothetical protein